MANQLEDPRTHEAEAGSAGHGHEHDHDHEGGPVKTFLEHLEDLRWVLIKSLVALGVGMLICLIGGDHVVRILTRPLSRAKVPHKGTNEVWTVSAGTNVLKVFKLTDDQQAAYGTGTDRFKAWQLGLQPNGTNGFLVTLTPDLKTDPRTAERMHIALATINPVGGFFVALQVALYGGTVLASPFIFYFVAGFIFPALRMKEKYYVYRGLGFGLLLFGLGVSFCYFMLMPVALSASAMYSNWLGFEADFWRAEEYISFVCKFMLGMGVGFQMPVVLLTLVKIGVLSYAMLSKMRRYMIVINLVLGAVLTTPEVLTQVMMAVPLQALYEITVWIAWYWERRDRKREEAERRREEEQLKRHHSAPHDA
ncbi:MAG TPA: twin-arginine translocase subunit TatC [Verrucomicrobiae bacterium]|nr:twin-arginine translocase subunit TatC [Verrucomicrobiae bacterium]